MPITGDGTIVSGLGGPAGYGEVELARSDDGSAAVDASAVFSGGLNYFGTSFDGSSLFVNTNGTLSFGAPMPDYPTIENIALFADVIAPFWADVDTRLDGEGAESGAIWVDLDDSAGVLTVTWDGVGVYRRDATVTNTFQLQIFDRGGGDFDVAFRYQDIQWTEGTAASDRGGLVGFAGSGLGDAEWIFEHAADLLALPTTDGTTGATGLWVYEMRGGQIAGIEGGIDWLGTTGNDTYTATQFGDRLTGNGGGDRLFGAGGDDFIFGGGGADRLFGDDGDDELRGGDGTDTLAGGDGNDRIYGGTTEADLRDVIYGGNGNDLIDGGYGNDELRGDAGLDTITGGAGADTVIGGDGDDVLTGQAWSDMIYGGSGDDFINGGFGYDRLNGGAGADRFFHLGIADHGSDWIQDFRAAEGDRLVFGGSAARSDFQVNFTETANAGTAGVEEAFVVYRPTGQIVWALVDGAAEDSLVLRLSGVEYDLLI